jgi:hypothetical protein
MIATATVAAGQEVCVACTGPAKTYRCQIAAGEGQALLKRSDKLSQLACIAELSRRGGHDTCAVKRDGFSTCLGDVEIVSATSATPIATTPSPSAEAAAGAPAPSPPPGQSANGAKSTEGPPTTMVELARRTGEASKKQLDKTGDAVGGAMKKTWRCMTSLFTSC